MQTPTTSSTLSASFVIVGGGIAGVTCAETIANFCPTASIIIITESNLIKTVTNVQPLSRYLFRFQVEERSSADSFASAGEQQLNINCIVDTLERIDANAKRAYTASQRCISYEYLCLCTGARPKLIAPQNPEYVLGIRDTDSVLQLQQKLKQARRIVLVGNGGIASELAYELKHVQVHWVIKDNHIVSTFVDPGAAYFFQQNRQLQQESKLATEPQQKPLVKRMRYREVPGDAEHAAAKSQGAALGPDWHQLLDEFGGHSDMPSTLEVHYKAEIADISQQQQSAEYPLLVRLTTDAELHCDFIISATGVQPRLNFHCEPALALNAEGYILVDELMQSNVPHIYAAGDICAANWSPISPTWFQMRLWTQARQMGAMAGRSMLAQAQQEQIYQDFCFELFGHVTQIFGFPVVLLGCFNGQGLGNAYEILLRSTPGKEYIKFVLCEGKLRGAILIGNTDLAETCENMILNELDLTPFGDDILDPNIDIEDFFD